MLARRSSVDGLRHPYCSGDAQISNPVFRVTNVSFDAGQSIFGLIGLSFGHAHHIRMVCATNLRQYSS
jgi:hypothetical protein